MIIGVIGAGTMGSGIAETAAAVGRVILVDVNQEVAEKGRGAVKQRLKRSVEREYITQSQKEALLAKITTGGSLEDLKEADFVIEAALEDLALKKGNFPKLRRTLPPRLYLGHQHICLERDGNCGRDSSAERVLGIHFFNPAARMKLVELVRTPFTSQTCFERTKEFTKRLGKTPVTVDESPGFVVNRLLIPMINEASFLLAEGVASAKDIDTAMQLGANHPMGPLALADLVGLDICLAVMETLHRELGEAKYRPAPPAS